MRVFTKQRVRSKGLNWYPGGLAILAVFLAAAPETNAARPKRSAAWNLGTPAANLDSSGWCGYTPAGCVADMRRVLATYFDYTDPSGQRYTASSVVRSERNRAATSSSLVLTGARMLVACLHNLPKGVEVDGGLLVHRPRNPAADPAAEKHCRDTLARYCTSSVPAGVYSCYRESRLPPAAQNSPTLFFWSPDDPYLILGPAGPGKIPTTMRWSQMTNSIVVMSESSASPADSHVFHGNLFKAGDPLRAWPGRGYFISLTTESLNWVTNHPTPTFSSGTRFSDRNHWYHDQFLDGRIQVPSLGSADQYRPGPTGGFFALTEYYPIHPGDAILSPTTQLPRPLEIVKVEHGFADATGRSSFKERYYYGKKDGNYFGMVGFQMYVGLWDELCRSDGTKPPEHPHIVCDVTRVGNAVNYLPLKTQVFYDRFRRTRDIGLGALEQYLEASMRTALPSDPKFVGGRNLVEELTQYYQHNRIPNRQNLRGGFQVGGESVGADGKYGVNDFLFLEATSARDDWYLVRSQVGAIEPRARDPWLSAGARCRDGYHRIATISALAVHSGVTGEIVSGAPILPVDLCATAPDKMVLTEFGTAGELGCPAGYRARGWFDIPAGAELCDGTGRCRGARTKRLSVCVKSGECNLGVCYNVQPRHWLRPAN